MPKAMYCMSCNDAEVWPDSDYCFGCKALVCQECIETALRLGLTRLKQSHSLSDHRLAVGAEGGHVR